MKDDAAAQTVSDALARLEGVAEIRLDILSRRVSVSHAGLPEIPQTICETLRNIGFRGLKKT